MDNITAKQTEHGDYDYSYDDLYRLTTADNPIQSDEAFTYDAVGNRLTAADTTGGWTYSFNNELEGYDNVSYVYDDNGNMVRKTDNGVVTSYVYNVEDRLTEVWDGDVGTGSLIASYYYDPFGRRLWKEVGGVRTYFHYGDEGLVGEYDGSGTEIKTYGYKPGSTWTTDPLFIREGTTYYFYYNDHLGTPQKLTAMNGVVVWSATYSSFGEATVDPSSTIISNLRFPGQYEDQETGLYYNYYRYYDPVSGRYFRPDPAGLTDGINVFVYTNNGPINRTDPIGLTSAEVGGGFSFTIPGWHFTTSLSTETCCDSDGMKQRRTISTTCYGISIGASFGGGRTPGKGAVSIVRENKKCEGKKGDEYEYEMGFGFSSALYGGASWSSSDPTTTTFISGLGGSLDFWSHCKNLIKEDVNTGECCEQ